MSSTATATATVYTFPDEDEAAAKLQELKDADPDQSYLIEIYGRTHANYGAFPTLGHPAHYTTFRSYKRSEGKWGLALVEDEITLPLLQFDTWDELCESLVWQNSDRERSLTKTPGYAIWDFTSIDED